MEDKHCGKDSIEIHLICTGKFNVFGSVCGSCGYTRFSTKSIEKISGDLLKIFPEKKLIGNIESNFSSCVHHDIHRIIYDTLNHLCPNGLRVIIDGQEKYNSSCQK